MRDEEISFFLHNLDDPEFINKGKTSQNLKIKNIYIDSVKKNDSILNNKSRKRYLRERYKRTKIFTKKNLRNDREN